MSSIRLKRTVSLIAAAAFIAATGLTACSGSGGGGGGTAAPVSAVSIGTMMKGSVIVNGVRFEDTAANIIADDSPKVLADGMTVKVKGTVNDDGLNGTAEKIEVDNEVRGAMTKTGADTFTVLGQTVLVDGGTIFANVANFAALADGNTVEVHGQRDAAGVIRATRVELMGAGAVDEVRGAVANKTASSFTIGGQTITFDGTTVMDPVGATFADGDIVEVHLNGTFATQIHPEDDFLPGENEEFEVEGFISGFSDLNSTFKVNDQTVQVSSSTRFDGGLKSELANDIKVEAEGSLSGGVLVARKIAFKETVRIESNAALAGSADMLGQTVSVTSKTEFQNLADESAILAGDGLRIRGFVNNDGSITATRIIKQSGPVDAGKDILQGPVSSKDATNKSLVILGITVSIAPGASSMDDSPDDNDVAFANIDAFLAAVTEGRTIVKAKGAFSGSTLAATELEIE
jgi:hypothetical protein